MINTRNVRRACLAIPLTALAACSSVSDFMQGDKLDYKSAAAQKVKTLEVPPDLSSLPRDDRFTIAEKGGTSVSTYNAQRAAEGGPTAPGSGDVLPIVKVAHMERAGGQRWLVVDKGADDLYPLVKEFWQDNGFQIKLDSPQTGIMETDWAENRAKIPADFIRNTIGKVFDSAYSTGERDKFRTRFERRPDGGTEIYISHRGAQEVLVGAQKDTTIWTERPSDPELEAEFLRRLLVRLGVDQQKSRTIVASAAISAPGAPVPHSRMVTASGAASFLEVTDPFDRTWRRVGLALDRVNFTVEDRDRTQGVYFVRYVDPDAEAKNTQGFISRMFSSGDKGKLAAQYRVLVREQTGGAITRVSVLNKDGVPESTDIGTRILTLLNEQLQ